MVATRLAEADEETGKLPGHINDFDAEVCFCRVDILHAFFSCLSKHPMRHTSL